MAQPALWNPQTAAARGAVYLDAVKPDWARVVNVHTLDIGSTDRCILGQCFEDYFTALHKLVPAFNGYDRTITEEYANRHAFAIAFGFQVPVRHKRGDYERLELAWKALILTRRRTRHARKTA